MVSYQRRIADDELDELLPGLPAISLEGPKGVGKTVTASRRAATILNLDEVATVEALRNDPRQLDVGPTPILIDEWQRYPEVWDRVRRSVDADGSSGRFLLTGSATPAGATIHSGAGRIVRIRMRPLSVAERAISEPTVSLAQLLQDGDVEINGSTTVGLPDYVREIVSSGLPGVRALSGRAQRAQLDSYLDQIVEREFPELGLRLRRPESLRGWLRAYAAATASTASYSTILDAATPGQSDKPTKVTTITYRDVLAQLFMLDPVEAWHPGQSSFSRLGSSPKHFLADPAFAARLLLLSPEDLSRGSDLRPLGPQNGTILGHLFEALIALSLKTYVLRSEAHLGHLRTRNGDHEVDFIVSTGRRTVAIEVKLSPEVNDHDVKHLVWLKGLMGSDLKDAVIITTGRRAYRRPDGVAVVPAALLGP